MGCLCPLATPPASGLRNSSEVPALEFYGFGLWGFKVYRFIGLTGFMGFMGLMGFMGFIGLRAKSPHGEENMTDDLTTTTAAGNKVGFMRGFRRIRASGRLYPKPLKA